MDLPREAQTVSDRPDDFEPRPLGSRNDLITAILSAAPTADFSDPSWGQILAGDVSIEVNMGMDEPVGSVMLHVRGGDEAIALMRRSLTGSTRERWTSKQARSTPAATSLAAWRSYRDRIISQQGQASR